MSHSPLYQNISKIYQLEKVLSNVEDSLIEYCLVDWLKPKNIWELGSGAGSWALMINSLYKSLEPPVFHLVEDFSYSLEGFRPDYPWPKTPEEFNQHLLNSPLVREFGAIKAECYFQKVEDLFNSVEKPIEFIRIDYNVSDAKNLLNWIYKNSSERLVILVDDILPNKCMQRLVMMIEEVSKGRLNTLWLGSESGAWCSTDLNPADFFNSTMRFKQDFGVIYVDEKNSFFQKKQQYLVTKKKSRFHSFWNE